MTNRARIAYTPLTDLIKSISQHTDACAIKIMTGKFPAQFRCGKYIRCDACLTAWLDEEESKK